MSEHELREVLQRQNNPNPSPLVLTTQILKDFKNDVWRTREREAIHISDMSDAHIRHARAMLVSGIEQKMYTNQAAIRVRKGYIRRFTEELSKRRGRKELEEFAKTREAVMADHEERMTKRTHEYGHLLHEYGYLLEETEK